MLRFLFYFMPAVGDIILGVFFFVSAKRMADSGASSYMIGLTMTTWAVFYALTCFIEGFFIKKHNATKFLKASQVIMLLALVGQTFTENLKMQFVWLITTGIGSALFFASFLPVTKLLGKEEALDNMIKDASIYTFSWSFGLAWGPFIAGFVWGLFNASNGWRYSYMIAIALMLCVTAGVFVMSSAVSKHLAQENQGNPTKAALKPAGKSLLEQRSLPDLMLAGWLLQGLGYIALAMMRTYLPDYCTKVLDISTFHQGIIMALISFSQAFTGLACYKAHTWPYRPWTVALVSLLGVIAFLIFATASHWLLYALAAVLFGSFTGVMCFVATFHALVNTEKTPRYVSVNETLVGIGSVLAPMLGGFLATHGGSQTPFYCSLACLLVCGLSYASFTWKTRFLK